MSIVYHLVPSLRRWLRYDFRASILGKAATIAQFLAIAALVLGLPARLPTYLAFGLGVIALADYCRRAVEIGRARGMATR
jgi:phosphatidylglycerophosphate synthase